MHASILLSLCVPPVLCNCEKAARDLSRRSIENHTLNTLFQGMTYQTLYQNCLLIKSEYIPGCWIYSVPISEMVPWQTATVKPAWSLSGISPGMITEPHGYHMPMGEGEGIGCCQRGGIHVYRKFKTNPLNPLEVTGIRFVNIAQIHF